MIKNWFTIGMTGILLLSLVLHFWGLDRFNTLVFDEVYYVKYAQNYLDGTPFFDAHPPLGKYAIALALSLGSHFPWAKEANNLGGVPFSPLTYRWLNALVGSILPLIVGAIAYQISLRRSYALIAAFFTTLDGLLLVESRYALINIYLVFFGVLGQWFFLLALSNIGRWHWFWLAVSGICFGASVAVKWNGLGFLLGIYLVWIIAWIIRWINQQKSSQFSNYSPLQNLTKIKLTPMLFNLGAIPIISYSLLWIPHLKINTKAGFFELHKQLLSFHQGLADGSSVHPYCSDWYTWPLTIRPMSYLYETAQTLDEPVPAIGPSLHVLSSNAVKYIYDVHAMGNPFLWWFSVAAIALLVVEVLERIQIGYKTSNFSNQLWSGLFLLTNYAANLLPWAKVTRCTFIYLYMGAAIFAFLSAAWLVDRWLNSFKRDFQAIGMTAIFLISMAFIFWLPIYLGLPLSPDEFKLRMWFRSWY
jgi:dolichyl-phosphate-mannose-protein mannosyltransferase